MKKLIISVNDGVLCGIFAEDIDLEVVIVDEDHLKGDGLSEKEIDAIYDDLLAGRKEIKTTFIRG